MLERLRFRTGNPAELSADLDRFIESLRRELTALEQAAVRRFVARRGIDVRDFAIAFEELARVHTGQGDVTVALPSATMGDAGRSVLVDRMSVANVLTVRGQAGQPVNSAPSIALPALIGVFPIVWTGAAWRTTEGQ